MDGARLELEAAQAVVGAPEGPVNPYRMLICPVARFGKNPGTVKGDSRRGPRASTVCTALVMAGNPPTPVAMIVAVRAFSSGVSGCHPACDSASSTAAMA